MNMQPVPLFGLGNFGKSVTVTAQERLNLYAEIIPDGEKERLAMYPTPGLETLYDLGANPIRGTREVGGNLYAVCGPALYKIEPDGTTTNLGLLLTSSGRVSMSDNGLQLMVVDNPNGYIVTLATEAFAQITDPDWPGAVTVTFLNQRFVVNKPDSGQFYISALLDGLSWDALDFATAESSPDNLVAVEADAGQLYLLGDKTTELWGDSGSLDFPFSRIGSSAVEWGLAAKNSLCKFDDSLMFLRQNRLGQVQVCRLAGASAQVVSTPEIDHVFNGYAGLSDATAFAYLLGGHPMYQINFNTADRSWLYDGSNGGWSRVGGDTSRHRADTHAVFNGNTVVGDYASGKIYDLSADYLTDDGDTIPREFIGRHQSSGGFSQFAEVWIEMEPGQGLQTGQGSDPQVMAQISRNGGKTWGAELWRSAGEIGEYGVRANWLRLGRARDWIFKFRVTDPIKTVFVAAWGRFQ